MKVNDLILYKRDVCKIKSILKNYYHQKDYYELVPINDSSLSLKIPVDNPSLKTIMSKKEAMDIVNKFKDVPLLDDVKGLENKYKELLKTDDVIDLVRVIKTTYNRNAIRSKNGKKIGDIDNRYFESAEKYFYTLLSAALDEKPEDIKKKVLSSLGVKDE